MEAEQRLDQCFLNKAGMLYWNTIVAVFSYIQYLTQLGNLLETWKLGKSSLTVSVDAS